MGIKPCFYCGRQSYQLPQPDGHVRIGCDCRGEDGHWWEVAPAAAVFIWNGQSDIPETLPETGELADWLNDIAELGLTSVTEKSREWLREAARRVRILAMKDEKIAELEKRVAELESEADLLWSDMREDRS